MVSHHAAGVEGDAVYEVLMCVMLEVLGRVGELAQARLGEHELDIAKRILGIVRLVVADRSPALTLAVRALIEDKAVLVFVGVEGQRTGDEGGRDGHVEGSPSFAAVFGEVVRCSLGEREGLDANRQQQLKMIKIPGISDETRMRE